MFYLDNNSGIDVMPQQKQTISRQQKWFTEGDTQTPPSYPGADWFNIIQAELLNVLKDGGITPSKSELNQLSAAIRSIINKNQIKISDASLTSKGVVQLNSATDSTIESQAATPKAVHDTFEYARYADQKAQTAYDHANSAHNRINPIADKFQTSEFESHVYSGDKRYIFVVRNDGISGVYNTHKNDFSWFFTPEGWSGGFIEAPRVGGLDQFVKERVLPVGIPQPWPSDRLPAGWLECNGSSFDVNEFPKLAAVYPWGTLPDLRGLFIRGKDNGRLLDPNRGILTHQGDAIRNIFGTFVAADDNDARRPPTGAFHTVGVGGTGVGGGSYEWIIEMDASRVVPVAHENRPQNIAFVYIVKAE